MLLVEDFSVFPADAFSIFRISVIMFDFLFRKREALPLPYKRDIHCHLIPGVDDGSALMTMSLDYLKALHEMGQERVVITPHHAYPNYMNDTAGIQPLYDKLVARLKAQCTPIVCEGFSFEYRMDLTFRQLLSQSHYEQAGAALVPFLGNHLLVECPWHEPDYPVEELIAQVAAAGYHPIMAHPERYDYWAVENRAYYDRLKKHGVDFQCNLLSFAGYYGEEVRKAALWLLRKGYVNFLGSDLHNDHQIHVMRQFLRSGKYADIYHDLVRCCGNDRL